MELREPYRRTILTRPWPRSLAFTMIVSPAWGGGLGARPSELDAGYFLSGDEAVQGVNWAVGSSGNSYGSSAVEASVAKRGAFRRASEPLALDASGCRRRRLS